jgi:hypothetical protein
VLHAGFPELTTDRKTHSHLSKNNELHLMEIHIPHFRLRRLLFIQMLLPMVLWTAIGSNPVVAQQNNTSAATDTLEKAGEAELGFGNGSFIVAPIPLKDPTLGTGLVLTAGYLFKADAGSDTSFVGFAGMQTSNGSEGYGAAANFYFGEGVWSVQSAVGRADVNYELSSVGSLDLGTIPISQEGSFVRIKGGYLVRENLTIGLDTAYLETTARLNSSAGFVPFDVPGFGLKVRELLIGPSIEWDGRDDNVYPTKGVFGSLTIQKGIAQEGLDKDFWKSGASGALYTPVGENGVFAANFTACTTSDGTPFFNLCGVGTTDGLRGYSAGQFLDNALLSAQAEYRHRFSQRWGGVGFAGVSAVGDSFGDLSSGPYFGGGLGVRYRLSKKFPLDFSTDITLNDAGDSFTYIYIGQSF